MKMNKNAALTMLRELAFWAEEGVHVRDINTETDGFEVQFRIHGQQFAKVSLSAAARMIATHVYFESAFTMKPLVRQVMTVLAAALKAGVSVEGFLSEPTVNVTYEVVDGQYTTDRLPLSTAAGIICGEVRELPSDPLIGRILARFDAEKDAK